MARDDHNSPRAWKVTAVRVAGDPAVALPVVLEFDSVDGLAQALIPAPSAPAVFVVALEDVSALLAFPQLFHDCGAKHADVPLARPMFGHREVALIRAAYASAKRLLGGVEGLLKEAAVRKQSGPFVVAAPRPILRALADSAGGFAAEAGEGAEGSLASEIPFYGLATEKIPVELSRDRFLGNSPAARLVRHLIVRCARNDKVRVLIMGPTGAGKEVVAQAIHYFGPRRKKPFKPINCGAIPTDLFESELYGYCKGAFSGAVRDSPGLWRAAADGTLFLDEIGELSLGSQAKLLRAIETNKVRPVGGTDDIEVCARVITATNRNLDVLVRAGRFRKDLYYRIRDLLLPVPALRTHVEDIPQLAQFFWRRIASAHGAKAVLSPAILAILCSYDWPGNVRELMSVLEALYAMYETPCPTEFELRRTLFAEGQAAAVFDPEPDDESSRLSADCLRHLRRADELLRACEVTLAPLLRGAHCGDAQMTHADEALNLRLQELEMLCAHPLLFGSTVTYGVVHRLKNRLQTLHQLLRRDLAAARRCWKKEIVPELTVAREAIFAEVGRG